jgi:hypothetical protein
MCEHCQPSASWSRRNVITGAAALFTASTLPFARLRADQPVTKGPAPNAIAPSEALDHLIEIVKRDRKWDDDGARKQLVQLFDAWGPSDEATVDGRRRLSSILFA